MRRCMLLMVLTMPLLIAIAADASFATCYGNDPCNACKNCKYCKHCAKEGGTCGVCKKRLLTKAQ
jgi:hypothetical protein